MIYIIGFFLVLIFRDFAFIGFSHIVAIMLALRSKMVINKAFALCFVSLMISNYLDSGSFNLRGSIIVLFPLLMVISRQWRIGRRLKLRFLVTVVFLCLLDLALISFSERSIREEALNRGLVFFAELGELFTVLTIAVLVLYSNGKRNYVFVAFGLMILASIKKNIIELLVFVLRRRLLIFLIASICLFFIGFSFSENVKDNIDYLNEVGFENHVRFGMYVIAVSLALSSFPLGLGAGNFGSLPSLRPYSDYYTRSGASQLGYNAEAFIDSGETTLLDTYWPGIIAEFGFLGILFFIIVIIGRSAQLKNHEKWIFWLFWLEGFVLFTPGRPLVLIMLLISLSNEK